MLDAAHDMGLQIASEPRRCEVLYLIAWARDDRQAARDHLRRCLALGAGAAWPANRRMRGLIWLARAGAPDEAREALEGWKAQCGAEPRAPGDPPIPWNWALWTDVPYRAHVCARMMTTVHGELARLEGRVGEAIPLLEQALAELQGDSQFYLVSDSLALAWLAQDEPSRAARVLDEAAQASRCPCPWGGGFSWLTLELRRAQVYRQLGRVEEAEQIEAGLRKLLAHADPDHVILRELKRLS